MNSQINITALNIWSTEKSNELANQDILSEENSFLKLPGVEL
jgi:hypothetical protein